MSRVRVLKNNFRSGVLAPSLKGLVDSEFYNSGLEIGRNIVVETTEQ